MKKIYFATVRLLSLVVLLLSAQILFAQSRTVTFNSSGSWKVPCGVTTATVYVWGAGGAGAGAISGAAYGSGGGGGAFIWNNAIPVTPGTTYTITVGAGGNGDNGNGDAGGNSSFSNIIVAGGGQGGIRVSAIGGLRGIGITVPPLSANIIGGNGAPGAATYGGGGGSTGSAPFNNAVDATGQPGAIAPAGGGNGGNGTVVNGNADGLPGASPGGGGGGARRTSSSRDGGDGAPGRVVIVYDGPPSSYCTPQFTSAIEPITSVDFAGIINTSPAPVINSNLAQNSLQTFCTPQGSVTKGNTYPITVKGNTDGNFTDHFYAFIDWNQNGVFNDAGEAFDIGQITNSTGLDAKTATTNILVPNNASTLLGKTMMRVMKRYSSDPTNPCATNYTYGEAEDYVINVFGTCQQATGATANNTSTSITVCSGTSVTLRQTGGALSGGQVWVWSKASCTGADENTNTNADAAYTFTPIGAGSTTFYVKARGGSCGTPGTGPCQSVTVNVVALGTIALNSGTTDFSACRNVLNSNFVRYNVGGGATGASVTGLPTGIVGSYGSGLFTISGTPTAAVGTYNYTVSLTGNTPCTNPTVNGVITITDKPTVSYAAGTFTYCIGSNITDNTPTFNNGGSTTTFSVSPTLPAGLSISATGVISGNPSGPASAATVYTVTATNSCGNNVTAATVTIAISAGSQVFNISPSVPQTICSTSSIVINLGGSVIGISYQLYRNGTPVAGTVVSGTGAALAFPAQNTAGTYTVVAITGCATNMNGSMVLNITPTPNTTFTYPSYIYCKTGLSPAATLAGIPTTGTFSSSPAGLVFSNANTGVIDLANSVIGINYSITYTVAAAGGCGVYSYTHPTPISITTSPNYYNVTGGGSYCSGGTGLAVGLSGSQSGATYELHRNGIALGITIPGTGGAISFGLQTVGGTYNIFASIGNCSAEMDGDATIVVNTAAPAISVSPASITVCQGVVVPLTATVGAPSVTSSFVEITSGNINQSIPDITGNNAGTSNLLKMVGIPAGATITEVSINYNIAHDNDNQLIINLKGPNGNVLNIADKLGGSGDNYSNTTVNNTSSTLITTASAPFGGTYLPQGAGGVQGALSVSANSSNVINFSGLYGATAASANGNWILSVMDINSAGNAGTFQNWKIKISYTLVTNPSSVTWSGPAASLYADPAGTIPYTAGTSASTVYAKPAATGNITAINTAIGGCTSTAISAITINPTPVILIESDYCNVGGTPGTVRIKATSNTAISNWLWNTGSTTGTSLTSFIEVSLAGNYYVSAKPATGCPGTGAMSIAQELVTNGNFDAGNVGFTTDYTYHLDQPGLVPAGQGELWDDTGTNGYGVGTNGQDYHALFFGVDHTYGNGSGNFMIINGHGSNLIVWQNENVTVLPNTKYYFSAYGMSLNASTETGNFRFEITDNNGLTTYALSQVLPVGVNDNSNNSWTKFYGEMTTGPNVNSVDIKIVNLNPSPGGNDFGIDDVSFATLSTFFVPPVDPTDTSQLNICFGSPIKDILYEAGGDGSSPTIVSGSLPPGVTAYWNGRTYRISGTPTAAGTFNFTLQLTTSCGNKQRKGTIIVLPAAEAGSFPGTVVSTCYNSSGSLATSLSGTAGTLVWESSPTGVAPWTTPVSPIYSNITSALYYRAIATNVAACKKDTSAVVKLGVANLWTGTSSADWTTVTNWSNEAVPTFASCNDVIIPNVSPRFQPNINSGSVSVKNLVVLGTGTLSINNDAKLAVSGNITVPVGAAPFTATNGKIELNGTTVAQAISGSWFVNRNIKELTISNDVNISATANDTLNILGALTFGNTTADLNTGNNITLKSSASATANVGQLAAGNIITGNVIVERYLLNGRKWRLLSAPTDDASQTIKSTWLENGVTPAASPVGYGFWAADTRIDAVTLRGFDVRANNTSVKIYNGVTDTWDAVDNTLSPIKNNQGYIVFVPGDRKVVFPASNQTTLRTKGKLYKGTQTVINNAPNNQFVVVGNPYASRVSVKQIMNNSTGISLTNYYVWDPSIGGSYGLGAFNTIYKDVDGDYKTLIPSPLYGAFNTPHNDIESGLAFMVKTTSAVNSMSIQESDKTTGSAVASFISGAPQGIRINLNLAGTTPILLDGAMLNFDDAYSNQIDQYDIRKMTTIGESVALKTSNTLLVIERRFTPVETDTLQIDMTKMTVRNYQWEIISDNMDFPGRQAYLLDRYLNTSTPLNMAGTTTVNFSIQNIPGSYAANRFQIVFKIIGGGPVPVTITSVAANRNSDKTVNVLWKVQNELNLSGYEVQRSVDGINFTTIITQAPNNNNGGSGSYQVIDRGVVAGDLFYRIKANSISGQIQYSAIVKVSGITSKPSISVYPNPVEGKTIHLQLKDIAAGTVYKMQLLNKAGQLIYNQSLKPGAGNSIETIQLNKTMSGGQYQLLVTDEKGTQTRIILMMQ